jgi:hypothetical protein
METLRSNITWNRLEDQIRWYDSSSLRSQRFYKWLKGVQLTLATSVPITSMLPFDFSKWLTAAVGASIAVLEGIQHMNQYSTLWVTYRSTAEYLKHDKFLFLSGSGPYKGLSSSEQIQVLAERIEERVSAEHANWFNETKRKTQPVLSNVARV